MAITDWPLLERPREKLDAMGPEALSDAELLAILLRTGIAGRSAVDLARDLLQASGGLAELLTMDKQEFCRMRGMGEAKYVQLQATLELGRRYLATSIQRGEKLNQSQLVGRYLASKLKGYPYEVFAVLFLDNQHRLICYRELFRGTIHSASIHPREVVREAMKLNAAALILAHNHPSGISEPSPADIEITEVLIRALQLVDVRVVDHFLIAGSRMVSFVDLGIMPMRDGGREHFRGRDRLPLDRSST